MAENTDVDVQKIEEDPEMVQTCAESDVNTENTDGQPVSLRVMITNLPKHANYSQMKQFIQKKLPSLKFSKLKVVTGKGAYFSFEKKEDVLTAINTFEGLEYKGNHLHAKEVDDPPPRKIVAPTVIKSAREIAIPLADLPYEDQLARKQKESVKIFKDLQKMARFAGIKAANGWTVDMVKPIIKSPVVEKYRNKTELTVGTNEKGDICVGFVATKLANQGLIVVPLEGCTHLKENTLKISAAFEDLVKRSVDKFNIVKDSKRIDDQPGAYKSILIRDFTGDCMVVVTIDAACDETVVSQIKEDLKDALIPKSSDSIPTHDFKVDSLYLVIQKNASDKCDYISLNEPKFVYEKLFGIRFKISPDTFFQTNTYCTEELYTSIGDALELPKPDSKIRLPLIKEDSIKGGILHKELKEESVGATPAKKIKIEEEVIVKKEPEPMDIDDSALKLPKPDSEARLLLIERDSINAEMPHKELKTESNGVIQAKNIKIEEGAIVKKEADNIEPMDTVEWKTDNRRILLLDICCGVGTIGLSLSKRVSKAQEQGKFKGTFGLVGVEIVKQAIEDAKETVTSNWFENPDNYRYYAAPAENVFKELGAKAPKCLGDPEGKLKLENGEVYGVLDPPRAGVNSKVIMGCRNLEEMKNLAFVSCDPAAAIKNIVDLCRPLSRRYEGTPFKVKSIQPVDMFPMTSHYEWVVQLVR